MTHFIRVRRKSFFSAKSDRDARIRKKAKNFLAAGSAESWNTQQREQCFCNRSERSNATADYTLIILIGFSLITWASISDAFRQLSVNVTTNTGARYRVMSNYPPRYRLPRRLPTWEIAISTQSFPSFTRDSPS